MYYIGIDNGLSGGITVLDDKQKVVTCIIMPVIQGKKKEYDVQKLVKFFQSFDEPTNIIIALEKAQPRFTDGSKSAFKTGFGYGLMQGLIESCGFSYEIVAPKVWQKEIFQGNVEDTKLASIMFSKKKYPSIDLRATERCKKDHDGKADSIGLATYCYRKNR